MSAATVPVAPSHPKIHAGDDDRFAASLVLGVLLVFVVERWDSDYGFRSADEIQSALGVRALALVPDLSRRETKGTSAEDYIVQKPNSAYAEALQRIRTSLFLTDGEHPPKTVLVTSSVPLEGKSTIAASLARQSARSGLKVILIDADLRRPRLHEVIGLRQSERPERGADRPRQPGGGDQARREVRASTSCRPASAWSARRTCSGPRP